PRRAAPAIHTRSLHDALPIFPISFSIATLVVTAVLHWLFGAPWEVAWWCIGGVFVIFGCVWIVVGNQNKLPPETVVAERQGRVVDRKSTRLNSSHVTISYAVF